MGFKFGTVHTNNPITPLQSTCRGEIEKSSHHLSLKLQISCMMSQSESESESISAASAGVSGEFKTLVDHQHLHSLNQQQQLILGRLQDSNAVLSHFNDYSEHCFVDVSNDFSKNTRLLKSIKSDLDYIFLKLRSIKGKIVATYPDAFPDDSTEAVPDTRPDLEMPQ